MIEKLETWQRPLPNNPAVVENMGMDNKSLFEKINELVDAVNELQMKVGHMEDGVVCKVFDNTHSKTQRDLEIAVDALNTVTATPLNSRVIHDAANTALEQITALEQKD